MLAKTKKNKKTTNLQHKTTNYYS